MVGRTRFTTDERAERVEHYRDWAVVVYQMLGLDHWDIRLKHAPPESDDAEAAVWRSAGSRYAGIHFGDAFFDAPREDQRVDLLHEYLHCHLVSFWEVTTALAEELAPTLWRVWVKNLEIGEEATVCCLSRALAPLFPLPPPWPPDPAEPVAEVALEIPVTTIFTDGERSERRISIDGKAFAELAAAVSTWQAAQQGGTHAEGEEAGAVHPEPGGEAPDTGRQ